MERDGSRAVVSGGRSGLLLATLATWRALNRNWLG